MNRRKQKVTDRDVKVDSKSLLERLCQTSRSPTAVRREMVRKGYKINMDEINRVWTTVHVKPLLKDAL